MVIELKIDPEFENLIPPSDEYEALENSIVNNGYDKTCPIRIWKGHNIIVDGHNRYRAVRQHGIVDFTTLEMEFDSREAVRDWMYREQLTRRNLDKLQRTYFMGMVYKAEKKPNGTNQHTMAENEGSRKSATQGKQSTAEKVGKLFHVSHETVKEAEKFADAVNKYAKNSEIKPYQLLSTFANEIKTTHTEIIDVSKNYSPEEQRATYNLIVQRKAESLTKAMNIVGKNRKKENGEAEPPAEPEPEPKKPDVNEQGKPIVQPEMVLMRVYKIKLDHMFKNEDDENTWLQCYINVDGEQLDCFVYLKDFNGNYIFTLPNVENLIIDYNEIFPTMTPIVSYRPIENEYLAFTRSFPIEEWNNFVIDRFSELLIFDESEKPEETVEPNPTKEPEKLKEEPEKPAKRKQKKEPEEPNPKEKPKEAKELKPESGEPKRDFTKDKEIMKQLLPTVGEVGISVQKLIDNTGRREDYDKANDKGKHNIEGLYQKFIKSQGFVSKKIGKGYRYVKVESKSAGVRRKTTGTRR